MHNILSQNMPATYIETAEYDCLHDEGVLYGKRLREAGANVTINETRGTIHGYDSALHTGIAIRSIKKRILFLRRGFSAYTDVKRSEQQLKSGQVKNASAALTEMKKV